MKGVLLYTLLLFSFAAFSQEKDKNLPKGNEEFADKNYAEAEANYRIAKSKAPTRAAASYNLGNSIYRQGKPGEAKFAYMQAIENAKTKPQKHLAFHNLGNSLMQEKNYQGAVEAYKNALRNNPYDEETRYNFALAKKMLKENPPKPEDKKDDKKDQKDDKNQKPQDPNQGGDDNKDKQDKDDKGDQKDNKDKGGNEKDKQDKSDKGKEEKQPQGESPSKQRMENLLDAMNNEEKKIQDKINAQKVKAQPKKQEKDW